ncbi:MAG TPA: 2-oxo-4-hydroxy-4-carboxy-5-ureidoimidazoline decarboxylase [Gemmatimonadota bacterium]|nr:2-oxo-4-hydroxy-4-carboxy-5-ureidoimidazoline decarboxylase [Gemmatimonadota bacterium]
MSVADSLDRLNGLTGAEAEAVLIEVCGARRWAAAVGAARPFAGPAELAAAAEAAWDDLARADWVEAFASHPRLGENRRVSGGQASAWSRDEQAQVTAVGEPTRIGLAGAQREYERRFGWPYIVCATGRSAEEILADCGARLANDPEVEIAVAAAEERRIGRLRLTRLVTEGEER